MSYREKEHVLSISLGKVHYIFCESHFGKSYCKIMIFCQKSKFRLLNPEVLLVLTPPRRLASSSSYRTNLGVSDWPLNSLLFDFTVLVGEPRFSVRGESTERGRVQNDSTFLNKHLSIKSCAAFFFSSHPPAEFSHIFIYEFVSKNNYDCEDIIQIPNK